MVGILTYHFAHNYGAMLQAYALKEFVGTSDDVEIINYCPSHMLKQYSINLDDAKIYELPPKLLDRIIRKKQYRRFEQFKENQLECSSKVGKEDLNTYTAKFNLLIVGSDQVWNGNINSYDSTYFLDFAGDSVNKIAYSASIGKSIATDYLARNFSVYLERFNKISFREASAATVATELCGIEFPTTVDPVFLLEKNKWEKLESPVKNLKGKSFILYYSLQKDRELEKMTVELARKEQLKIVSIHPLCIPSNIAHVNVRNVGPQEFLWLISHASYISSNSFHATAFSIIYQKKALLRNHVTLGDRTRDLLRLVDADTVYMGEYYDFGKANFEKLHERISFSKEFLQDTTNTDKVGTIIYPERPRVFAARHHDKNVVLESSSGGIFRAMCEVVFEKKGVVAAAGYNYSTNRVEHSIFTSMNAFKKYLGSKYIQSYAGTIYKEVAEYLKKGQFVLFVGTACQVHAMKKYCLTLNLNMSKLYLCDVICHGVPSPGVWEEFILSIQKKLLKPISYISFRDKRRGWAKPTVVARTEVEEVVLQEYADLFYSDIFLRPSCYNCAYASLNKPSDITIGDYWGINCAHPDFYSELGNSLILIHTPKGDELFNELMPVINYRDSNTLACIQNNLLGPTERPVNREQVWNYYRNHGISCTMNRYFPQTLLGRVVKKIRKIIKRF